MKNFKDRESYKKNMEGLRRSVKLADDIAIERIKVIDERNETKANKLRETEKAANRDADLYQQAIAKEAKAYADEILGSYGSKKVKGLNVPYGGRVGVNELLAQAIQRSGTLYYGTSKSAKVNAERQKARSMLTQVDAAYDAYKKAKGTPKEQPAYKEYMKKQEAYWDQDDKAVRAEKTNAEREKATAMYKGVEKAYSAYKKAKGTPKEDAAYKRYIEQREKYYDQDDKAVRAEKTKR